MSGKGVVAMEDRRHEKKWNCKEGNVREPAQYSEFVGDWGLWSSGANALHRRPNAANGRY